METILVQCCVAGCGHSPFPMAADFERRARRTHEWWYCPAGHSQHWSGQTREERRIAELEGRVEVLRAENSEYWERVKEAARRCPWPGCDFKATSGDEWDRRPLQSHMRSIHGMPSLAAIREAS